jgi:hypothetical protein
MNNIELYTIDFVRYILERHQFSIINVFLALEKAKFAQIYALDLSLWFTTDNEVNYFLLINQNRILSFLVSISIG